MYLRGGGPSRYPNPPPQHNRTTALWLALDKSTRLCRAVGMMETKERDVKQFKMWLEISRC